MAERWWFPSYSPGVAATALAIVQARVLVGLRTVGPGVPAKRAPNHNRKRILPPADPASKCREVE
jgi:hypothetical protein